ncbi:MAG: threonine/serine exporter family protein [Xanthomonadaceae bacterium]|nr:threonine/serine exporter family protein [Xanthomonadaceae bacterium]
MSTTAPRDARMAFVAEIARRLHQYGTAAPRLENAVSLVAQRLGLAAEVWCSPTAIILTLAEPGGNDSPPLTQVMRLPPGDVHLARLCVVDRIADQVIAGALDVSAGFAQLRALSAPPPRGWAGATVAAFGMAAAAVATLLHTSWAGVLAAGLIGLLIGLLSIAGSSRPRLAAANEAIAAFVATLVASLIAAWIVPLAVKPVVLSALIVLMPGLTLTTAVRELSTQHLVSGVARMAGALATLLKLTFGTLAAAQLCMLLGVPEAIRTLPPVPGWADLPALLFGALAFAVLFQAARRDWPLVMASAVLGYAVTRAGGSLFGAGFGVFLGGLLMGALSNLYARHVGRPGALVREPGIILLVPGSVGFRSVGYLLERDVNLGVNAGMLLVTLLVALVAGLLFGDLLVSPRRSL